MVMHLRKCFNMKYLLLFMWLLPSLTFAQKNKTYVRVVPCAATAPSMCMTVLPQHVVKASAVQDFYAWAQLIKKTTTSVSNVETNKDKELIKVYNLDGRIIQIVPSEGNLKQLPKGIYIARGKKIVVR